MEKFQIPKLSRNNYSAWSIRKRSALVQKGCQEAIDPEYSVELSDNERNTNEKALPFLFLVVEDEYSDDIADCLRAKEAWASFLWVKC